MKKIDSGSLRKHLNIAMFFTFFWTIGCSQHTEPQQQKAETLLEIKFEKLHSDDLKKVLIGKLEVTTGCSYSKSTDKLKYNKSSS